MLGAIVGDIVGSVYEWNNIKTKEFPLFRADCRFTDDTVMTCAVADAIMSGGSEDNFIDSMKTYGRMFPNAGYGGKFTEWLFSDTREPYYSFGNGSAMRVSPCGWVKNSRELARRSAMVTHNHPEGVKGALAVTDAIVICREFLGFPNRLSECKKRLKAHTEQEYGYNLSQTLDDIRPTYGFHATCQDSVPQAIIAFLESTDFEDAIRNGISLGGDSDTIAAIAGSIAEVAYGIPKEIAKAATSYLPAPLLDVVTRWEKFVKETM